MNEIKGMKSANSMKDLSSLNYNDIKIQRVNIKKPD